MLSGDLWRQENTFEQILAGHEALARKIAHNYKDRGTDLDDLQQLALIGLYQGYMHYDPDRGVKFSTYAVYWIKKQVLGAFNSKADDGADDESHGVGVSTGAKTYTGTASEAKPCSEREKMQLPMDMPPLEKDIIQLSIGEQLSLKEISARLKLSVERVKQHRQKALRRIRAIRRSDV